MTAMVVQGPIEVRVVDSAANGRTVADIARRHGLSLDDVREILTRRGWDVPADPGRRPMWTGRLMVVEPLRAGRTRERGDSVLTARELVVLRLIAQGLTDVEIADREQVSKHTVHTQVRRACEALGASTRAHAVALAFRAGLLT